MQDRTYVTQSHHRTIDFDGGQVKRNGKWRTSNFVQVKSKKSITTRRIVKLTTTIRCCQGRRENTGLDFHRLLLFKCRFLVYYSVRLYFASNEILEVRRSTEGDTKLCEAESEGSRQHHKDSAVYANANNAKV